ncbi:MAG: GNAT family N-acetyltransferase, partial [Nanoarchaeota archaeon]|nr:GNAT family N-acetyltransferase [Nanoarchaeota archaeon]
KDVVDATESLKNAGFKVGYHIMPGLPGSSLKKDLKLFKKLFSDEKFKPDQLKIYPCQVMPSSELENLYWKKKYVPYTKLQIQEILVAMLKEIPRYCRVMRIMREIPPQYIVAGTRRIDLRKDIEEKLRKKRIKLKEIRFREIGFALQCVRVQNKKINLNLKLKITKYQASNGKEFFLEIANKNDTLFALLRLRIIGNNAIVRELHVYGPALKLGERNLRASQHQGLGKWLMSEAEKISKKNKIKKLKIISGVGAREYYRKLGYNLDKDEYMVKFL